MPGLLFPEGFIWGAATSAYQIEGGHDSDGKGESVWDRFTHTSSKILNHDTGDIACDHYHLFEKDIALMKELGVGSYRFSISWPRIFPDGRGKPNQKGLDFYRNLARLLAGNGIQPAVTLYHWDLPQKLQDLGGWENREIIDDFEMYARTVFEALGDDVPIWMTLNEPWVSSFVGNWYGGHPPALTDFPTALKVAHHLLLAHGKAVRAFREMQMKGEIGIALNLNPVYPASEDEQDLAAARRYGDYNNGWFLDPIFKGNYPAELSGWLSERLTLPEFSAEDMSLIHTPIDFLGVNTYASSSILHDPGDWPLQLRSARTGKARTHSGWEIYPEGLYDLLQYLHAEYGGIKMMITENGAAFKDRLEEDGKVEDDERLVYLYDHISQAHRAIRDGVNLSGYYVWSLLDNFEWNLGYSRRFGLVYVDFATQERTIKKSGWWYKRVIENNRLVAG
ncbi:MAG: beta-glucosidase [Chloroflexota bacterium]|nr:MAG: beta-glucosidase [Chloroflexota bacterium]